MVRCRCRCEAIMKTSWTDQNSGRRFYCCPKENGCGIVDWHDPEMCKRSKKVIPGLLRNINRKQVKIDELESELEIMRGDVQVLMNVVNTYKMEAHRLRIQVRNQKLKIRVGVIGFILCLALYLLLSNREIGVATDSLLTLAP